MNTSNWTGTLKTFTVHEYTITKGGMFYTLWAETEGQAMNKAAIYYPGYTSMVRTGRTQTW
jgi:hypothetical protein